MRAPFLFRSEWHADASEGELFDILADVAGYAAWWPQVRSTRVVDESTVECVIRSALPVPLRLRIVRVAEGREAGVLRVRIEGDLAGWAQWTVRDGLARWDQECSVRKQPMASLPSVLRPVARINHEWMMRGGERGLRRHLAECRRRRAR